MQVIPCLHESGQVKDLTETTPDHHPLTKEEIAALLEEAKDAENPLVSQIQVRLCQGIPGYVCPRVIEGPVSEKEVKISRLYLDNFRSGADPQVVEQIYATMMG